MRDYLGSSRIRLTEWYISSPVTVFISIPIAMPNDWAWTQLLGWSEKIGTQTNGTP